MLYHYLKNEPTYVENIRIFIYYFWMSLVIKSRNKNMMALRRLVQAHKQLSMALSDCKNIMEELKEYPLCDDITVFDVLSNPMQSIIDRFNYDSFVIACEKLTLSLKQECPRKFEIYYNIALARITLAHDVYKILSVVKPFLNEIFMYALKNTSFQQLPESIVRNILGFLNIRDLRKIATLVSCEKQSLTDNV